LASRLSGIDAILGGHTHDALPRALEIANPGGVTLVTNAGSNGKFIGVLDFAVRGGRIREWSYELLPVFAELLPPDPDMEALIARIRAPFLTQLNEPLAQTDALLYRRGNFNGSVDQLICDALMEEMDAPIALSPGFRWGTTLLPGDIVTMEHLMSQVAITYPEVTLTEMTGARLKQVLEDVATFFILTRTTSKVVTWSVQGGCSMPLRPWHRSVRALQIYHLTVNRSKRIKLIKWQVGRLSRKHRVRRYGMLSPVGCVARGRSVRSHLMCRS